MTLGFVKDLRAEMNIDSKYDDSMIVCIYGRTDSIIRRSKEHNNGYKNIKNAVLRLKYEAYVDPMMLSKAETEVSNYVTSTNCRFLHETETEMFIVDEKQLKLFETQYENIAKKYMGNKAEIINQLKDKDNEINNLQLIYEKKIIETQQEIRVKYSDLLDKLREKNELLEKKLNDEYRNNLNLEKKHCVEIKQLEQTHNSKILSLYEQLNDERNKNILSMSKYDGEIKQLKQQLTELQYHNKMLTTTVQKYKKKCRTHLLTQSETYI